jgi:hypothetical protein
VAQALTTQRISEVLAAITLDAKQTFLKKWMLSVLEDDYPKFPDHL